MRRGWLRGAERILDFCLRWAWQDGRRIYKVRRSSGRRPGIRKGRNLACVAFAFVGLAILCPVFNFKHVVFYAIPQPVRVATRIIVIYHSFSDRCDPGDDPFTGLELLPQMASCLQKVVRERHIEGCPRFRGRVSGRQKQRKITFGEISEGYFAFRTLPVLFALLLPLPDDRTCLGNAFQEVVMVKRSQSLHCTTSVRGVDGRRLL